MTEQELELERARLALDERAMDLAYLRHQLKVEQSKVNNELKRGYLELARQEANKHLAS